MEINKINMDDVVQDYNRYLKEEKEEKDAQEIQIKQVESESK